MEYYKKKGEDLNTYFSTVVTNGSKTIDVGRANVGITKIYGLIGSGTASGFRICTYRINALYGSGTYRRSVSW